jgi:hypothetical protein
VYAPVSPTANVARIRTLALPDNENVAVGDAGMYAGVLANSSVCGGVLVRRASGGRILLSPVALGENLANLYACDLARDIQLYACLWVVLVAAAGAGMRAFGNEGQVDREWKDEKLQVRADGTKYMIQPKPPGFSSTPSHSPCPPASSLHRKGLE